MTWKLSVKQKKIIGKLYPPEKREETEIKIIKKMIIGMGLVFITFVLLGILYSFAQELEEGHFLDSFRLVRPGYGEGSSEFEIEILSKEMGNTVVNVDVTERVYDENTVMQAFTESWKYIESVYLGKNSDKNSIVSSLVLPEQIPMSSIHVKWDLDNEEIVLKDGSIQWGKLNENITVVQIFATLQYGEWEDKRDFVLEITPQEKSMEDQFLTEWKKSFDKLQMQTQNENYASLPQKIEGKSVYYQEVNEKDITIFVILGIIGVILVPLQIQKSLEKKEKYRLQQIQMDYPNIVNKFVLLLGAGMTINGAWARIAQEYNQKKGSVVRYAYEEMLYTEKEIQNGVSEIKAYESYGKRMEQLDYLKLSTLISQNLRKGSKRLLELLEFEAMDAFEKRKEFAKKLGEEAGTKLLFPMILMLVLVMFLLIIPAFMSF